MRVNPPFDIREIDPDSDDEVAWVASRMRQTLVEVLGEEEGGAMYTREWLSDRVRFHLDPERSTAKVFVSEDASGALNGHAIVRLERGEDGRELGLFSTIFVEPDSRGRGLADALIGRVEAWLGERRAPSVEYYTAESHEKLIRLFRRHGYAITAARADKKMVVLSKPLAG